MNKKSMIIYTDWLERLEGLTDEQVGKFFRAVLAYGKDGEELPIDDPIVATVFTFVKPTIQDNNQKYEQKIAQLQEAHEKWLAKRNTRDDSTRFDTNRDDSTRFDTFRDVCVTVTDTVTDTVTVTDTDTVNNNNVIKSIKKESTKKESRFQRPTLPQIQDYVFEKALNVDPERFFDYYESNGWRVGRNPMKDWKAALRNWSSKDSKKNTNTTFAAIDELLREEGYDGAKGMV